MAYTEPPTIASATTGTAADANIWSEDIRYLKGQADALAASAVKLNRTSAQSIPNNVWTPVTWNNQLGDIGGWWSSGTDIIMPSDFPAGVAAYFVLSPAFAFFATNATGARGIRSLLNGAVVEQYTTGAPAGDPTVLPATFTFFEVAEADVITFEVFQTSGGALNLSGVVVSCIRQFPSG